METKSVKCIYYNLIFIIQIVQTECCNFQSRFVSCFVMCQRREMDVKASNAVCSWLFKNQQKVLRNYWCNVYGKDALFMYGTVSCYH